MSLTAALPRGVYRRGSKFLVRVSVSGCKYYGGIFPTVADAAQKAAQLAAQRLPRLGIQMSYDWNAKARPIRVRVLDAGKRRTIGRYATLDDAWRAMAELKRGVDGSVARL